MNLLMAPRCRLSPFQAHSILPPVQQPTSAKKLSFWTASITPMEIEGRADHLGDEEVEEADPPTPRTPETLKILF